MGKRGRGREGRKWEGGGGARGRERDITGLIMLTVHDLTRIQIHILILLLNREN